MRIPALNSFVGVLIFFILFCGCAQAAGVSYTANAITVSNTTTVNNLTALYAELVSMNGGNETAAQVYLKQVEPKVWESLRIQVIAANTNFYINDTDCVELRIDPTLGIALEKNITVANCTLTAWNRTTNAPEVYASTGLANFLKPGYNVTFNNFVSVFYGKETSLGYISNIEISHITLNHTREGMYVQLAENVTVHDIYVHDGYRGGIDGTGSGGDGMDRCIMNNSTIYNLTVINCSDYTVPTTGSYGLVVLGNNNIIHDIFLDGIGWSGTVFKGNNFTLYNMTTDHTGHNGWEFSGNDSTVWNVTSKNSTAYGFFQCGKSESNIPAVNNSYKDMHIINPGTTAFGIIEGSKDTTADDIFIDGANLGVYLVDSQNVTVSNISTVNSTGNSFATTTMRIAPFNVSRNHIVKDSDLRTPKSLDVYLTYSQGIKIINCLFNTAKQYYGDPVQQSFYFDLAVKNKSGTPLNGTTTILNEVNPLILPFNVLGTNQSDYTFQNGRTPFPSSPSVSAVLPDRSSNMWVTFSNYEYTSNISTTSGNVSLDNINPDSTWYRPIPSISNYTITAIVNDSTSLHITGYAPTPEYNNFSSGDSIKFQIWANEPLTSVVWKKDGIELQNSTSTTYETTISEAPITVDITGQSETGTITKTWTIDPNQVVEPIPDPEPEPDPEDPVIVRYPPVANFTSDVTTGAIPLKVNFTDTSTNATSWYWDFDNNGQVDSTVRNATFTYRTQGNYTVKLTVSNADGANTSIKTEYIQAEKQSWYIIFWNYIFGVAGGVIAG